MEKLEKNKQKKLWVPEPNWEHRKNNNVEQCLLYRPPDKNIIFLIYQLKQKKHVISDYLYAFFNKVFDLMLTSMD